MQENWKSRKPLPDMRILIFEPTVLKQESLRRLQDVGWGLCQVPRLEILKVFFKFKFDWRLYEVFLD